MKYGNKGSETKQWQQGYFIPIEEVRFEGHGKSESRVQISSGSGREGRGKSSRVSYELEVPSQMCEFSIWL